MDQAHFLPPNTVPEGDYRPSQPEVGEAPEVLSTDHPERASLQDFIAQSYFRTYGARVDHFAHQLMGLRRPDGPWLAGVGYTFAANKPLFIEQYLDRPVEIEIAARLRTPIGREQVVEVGNFAAVRPGGARRVIICMTELLHELGRTWVVFTSTRSLLNSFSRLGIATIVLEPADPLRLSDGGAKWGSYYETNPQVIAASIPLGFLHLVSRPGAIDTFNLN